MRRSARHPAAVLVTVAAAAALAGCGGGGDDGGSNGGGFGSPADVFNPLASWQSLLSVNRVWNVSGADNFSRPVAITFATAPGPASIFPVTGVTTARSDAVVTTTSAGVTVRVDQQTYFDPATLLLVGLRSSVDGQLAVCDVATGLRAAPPSAARIPSRGTLATLDARDGCVANSSSVATITLDWVLATESGIAYFCIESTERTGATVRSVEQDCVQTGPDGALGPAARITLQNDDGVTVVAR